MQRITTKTEFIERLKDALAVEISAKNNYEKDLKTFTNLEIYEKIRSVKLDEEKHIALLKSLIGALSS